MAHKGRQGPRTLHRELSILSPPRYHAPSFLRMELDINLDNQWVMLQSGWSTEAVFVSHKLRYAWDLVWIQQGLKFIVLIDMECRTDIGFGLLWTYRLDQFGVYGSADFRTHVQHPEVWWPTQPTYHGPGWLDVTIFGTRIKAIGESRLFMRQWSDMP